MRKCELPGKFLRQLQLISLFTARQYLRAGAILSAYFGSRNPLFFCLPSPFGEVNTLPCFEETLQQKRAGVWEGGNSAALPDVSFVSFSPCRMSAYRSFLIRADRDLERLIPCEAVVTSGSSRNMSVYSPKIHEIIALFFIGYTFSEFNSVFVLNYPFK